MIIWLYFYIIYVIILSSPLVVYTPQRKCARRLNEEEIMYDNESVSQILLNDPNSAFISNPVRKKYMLTRLAIF